MDRNSGQYSIENVLSVALQRLGRPDSYKTYLDYISSEWYTSVPDLLLALEDGNAWTDLQLPGRLKLEMKSELLLLRAAIGKAGEDPFPTSTKVNASAKPKEQWAKYFSSEHNAYFYHCNEKDVTQWDVPTGGNIEIIFNIAVDHNSAEIETINIDEVKDSTNTTHAFCASATSSTLSSPIPSTHTVSDSLEENPDDDISHKIPTFACAPKEIEVSSDTDKEIIAEAVPEEGYRNNEEGLVISDSNYSMETIIVTDAYAADDYVPIGIAITSPAEFEESPTASSSSSIPYTSLFHTTSEVPCKSSTSSSYSFKEEPSTDSRLMISALVDMGFSADAAAAALKRSGNDLPGAASLLLLSPPAYNDVISTSSVKTAAVHVADSTVTNKSASYSNREDVQASAPPSNMISSTLLVPEVGLASSQVPKSNLPSQGSVPLIAQEIENIPKKVMYAPRKKVALTSTQRPSAPNLSLTSGY